MKRPDPFGGCIGVGTVRVFFKLQWDKFAMHSFLRTSRPYGIGGYPNCKRGTQEMCPFHVNNPWVELSSRELLWLVLLS